MAQKVEKFVEWLNIESAIFFSKDLEIFHLDFEHSEFFWQGCNNVIVNKNLIVEH